MDKIIQICPIGLEVKRVISGYTFHPSNVVYLLTSRVDKKALNDKRKRLVELSNTFAHNIKTQISPAEVIIRPCSFIQYESIIRDLCDVIREIYNNLDKKDNVQKIWFNSGTATKLFAIAAMYIASFNTKIFHIFYVGAENYTINLLFDEETTKEEILDIYEKHGITYPKDIGIDDYSEVSIPIVSSEKINKDPRKILIHLLKGMKNFIPERITYKNLLSALENIDLKSLSPEKTRALKMKYRHHIVKIMNKQLIDEQKHGKQKSFCLTKRGVIVAMILSCLEEVGLIDD